MPAPKVVHEAKVNPRLLTKSYRLEPPNLKLEDEQKPSHLEIKTSSLANRVERSRFDSVRRLLDETDFEARRRVKKPEWFL